MRQAIERNSAVAVSFVLRSCFVRCSCEHWIGTPLAVIGELEHMRPAVLVRLLLLGGACYANFVPW
jgi:hypothetical protein